MLKITVWKKVKNILKHEACPFPISCSLWLTLATWDQSPNPVRILSDHFLPLRLWQSVSSVTLMELIHLPVLDKWILIQVDFLGTQQCTRLWQSQYYRGWWCSGGWNLLSSSCPSAYDLGQVIRSFKLNFNVWIRNNARVWNKLLLPPIVHMYSLWASLVPILFFLESKSNNQYRRGKKPYLLAVTTNNFISIGKL